MYNDMTAVQGNKASAATQAMLNAKQAAKYAAEAKASASQARANAVEHDEAAAAGDKEAAAFYLAEATRHIEHAEFCARMAVSL